MKPDELNTDQNEVLIVGAGPAGLMMACQLAIHGIKFRIIDKKTRQASYSGALLIQARTLEIFDQMGLANSAIRMGETTKSIAVLKNGRRIFGISTGKMGSGVSKFPYILMLKQTHTEQLMLQWLDTKGISVERNVTLIKLQNQPNGVVVGLSHADGTSESFSCRYLVGADGAYSTVRRQLGIPWKGSISDAKLFVTDCQLNYMQKEHPQHSPYKLSGNKGEIVFSISDHSIAGFFPLQNNMWRIDSVIPDDISTQDEPTFSDVTAEFSNRIRMDVHLTEPSWFSTFQPATFLADTFRTEHCFLIGDAAHVHTPIGAQGMNTGMQDAHNLAWKLAFKIRYHATDGLLESYHVERRPIAQKLIDSTDKYFNITIGKRWQTKFLRTKLIPICLMLTQPLLKQPILKRRFFKGISQTSLRYGKGITRLPYLKWVDELGKVGDLHELIKGDRFVLIILNRTTNGLPSMHKTFLEVLDPYSNAFTLKDIPFTSYTRKLYKKLKIRHTGFYLVRPDGYIALSHLNANLSLVQDYFKQIITRNAT